MIDLPISCPVGNICCCLTWRREEWRGELRDWFLNSNIYHSTCSWSGSVGCLVMWSEIYSARIYPISSCAREIEFLPSLMLSFNYCRTWEWYLAFTTWTQRKVIKIVSFCRCYKVSQLPHKMGWANTKFGWAVSTRRRHRSMLSSNYLVSSRSKKKLAIQELLTLSVTIFPLCVSLTVGHPHNERRVFLPNFVAHQYNG